MVKLGDIAALIVAIGERTAYWRDGLKALLSFTRATRFIRLGGSGHVGDDRWLVRLGTFWLDLNPFLGPELAIDIATLAERSGDPRGMAKALRHAYRRLDKVKGAHLASDEAAFARAHAYLTLLDLAAAQSVATQAVAQGLAASTDLAEAIAEIANQVQPWRHVIDTAAADLRDLAEGKVSGHQDATLTIFLPNALTRIHPEGYAGFRATLRAIYAQLFARMEQTGIPIRLIPRLGTHGVIDCDSPYVAYHTIGARPNGVHIKETERRGWFSVDSQGYSGWAAFAKAPLPDADIATPEEIAAFIAEERRIVIGGNQSKYDQPATERSAAATDRPYIFVPTQVIGDAVQRLARFHPIEMLEEVVAAGQRLGIDVLVKRHPRCKSWAMSLALRRAERRGLIKLVDGSIHDLIAGASAVCVVNSGTGAEALLHGKPVYTFGEAEYQAATFRITRPGEFADVFVPHRLPVPPEDIDRLIYALRHSYSANPMERDITALFPARFLEGLQ
ncbi:capsular polysaccharide export protein, LipB/KpsS family [Oryzibacter oryziterrae]|uniref:capsular polysaccharide export protein, LipB/KpsS family n=1 Tax=Oryzibacter oryziterrae TaxID=2766474 RepID=UPI001F32A354|nr:hypothetical protein [Oryzibacter oryziterrae]